MVQTQVQPAAAPATQPLAAVWPQAPQTVAATGLPPSFLEDLLLKTIHYSGPGSLDQLARRMGLTGPVLEEIADGLRGAGAVEMSGAPLGAGYALSPLGYRLTLTSRGEQRLADALNRSRYGGVAPVTLPEYAALVRKQSLRRSPLNPRRLASALAGFVLAPPVQQALARAFHSGRAALLYGESGNGKTAIVEALSRAIDDTVLVPAAIYANGQLIRVFDPSVHQRVAPAQPNAEASSGDRQDEAAQLSVLKSQQEQLDRRWLPVRRPVIAVAGELSPRSLDLRFDDAAGFYIAPLHLKAQDGVFFIDDFGRQQMSPEELLNRWSAPLERGADLLTLATGEHLLVPFELTVLFATNLQPAALAGDGFLRRIPYKVHVTAPGPDELAEITRRECRRRGWQVDEAGVQELVRAVLAPGRPRARGVVPRDLLSIIEDGARFAGAAPQLTPEAIAEACAVYFLAEERR